MTELWSGRTGDGRIQVDWGGSAHRKRFGGDEFLVEEAIKREESDYEEAVDTSWDGSSRRCWQLLLVGQSALPLGP